MCSGGGGGKRNSKYSAHAARCKYVVKKKIVPAYAEESDGEGGV